MRLHARSPWIVSFFLILALAPTTQAGASDTTPPAFAGSFAVDPQDLSTTGSNTYFILQPGYCLVLGGTEHGKHVELTITVLDETKTVAGVETRVVEERETYAGQLTEVSRNFCAISKTTHDVYYFGEEVDNYEHGKLTGHAGGWLAEGANRCGLLMPGEPRVGARYYEEHAPKLAMDRARIVSCTEALATPAGKFTNVLEVEETTPLEPGEKEYKFYAPGIGLIQDEGLRLEKFSQLEPNK